jgi:hypothetical protein
VIRLINVYVILAKDFWKLSEKALGLALGVRPVPSPPPTAVKTAVPGPLRTWLA